jgi:VWFA-related protein
MKPRLLPALLLLSLAGRALAAAPSDKEKPKTAVFSTEVSVVSVPVFVVNQDGKALRGLGAEDFELYEDGKRVEIVAFRYVDTTSDDQQELIRQAPAARRRFLLIFDLAFTDPGGLHSAQAAAHDFVRSRLAESDLAAVATFDTNRGLRIVANFTEDRALLVRAVDTLGVPTLARIADPLNLSFESTDIQGGGGGGGTTEPGEAGAGSQLDQVLMVMAQRLRASEENLYRAQVLGLLSSMQELGKALRGIEGRKQLLYFSAGFDSQALVGLEGADARTASEAVTTGRLWEVDSNARYGDPRLRNVLQEMTKALSSADCVVHAVDVTGLGTDNSLTQTAVRRDAARQVKGRESLHYVSAETGGRFFKDTNDLGAVLGEVSEMTDRFYILGYQRGSSRGPGQFHRIKVRVERKGAKISHRAGYFERLPVAAQSQLQRRFEAAQLVMTGAGPNEIHFSSLALPFPMGGDRQTLGVVVQVPREELRWDPARPIGLEVYGYAVGADGAVADHVAQLARIDTGKADPGGTAAGLSFYGTFHVPPGQYTIRLMVQDTDSGAAGVQFMDVTVPAHDPRVGFLLPPVVMDDPSRWLGLEMGRGEKAPSPFHIAGKPFVPRTSFQVKSGSPEKLVLIAYEPGRPQDPAAGIEIQSSLSDASGKPVPAGFLRIEKVTRDGGGRRTYLLAYTPEALAPGDYTLRVGIGESGEARLESYALLRIKGTPQASQ